eukprot:FR738618.1.p1 GENE.FR738618.1~~FR738618.1.p1  ORF type:complete len:140 (+),score=15.95 FR738618.1:76-495(+)
MAASAPNGQGAPPPCEPAPSRGKLGRQMSTVSESRLKTLETLQLQFDEMVSTVTDYEDQIKGGALTHEELLQIKSELAQLNGALDKFQFESIDGVMTGDLDTGKLEAKSQRKKLNNDVDRLRTKVAGLHKNLSQKVFQS